MSKRVLNLIPEQSSKRPFTRSSANQLQSSDNADEKRYSVEVLIEDDDIEDIPPEYILAESDCNNTESEDGLSQNPFNESSSDPEMLELEQLTNADFKGSDEAMDAKDIDGVGKLHGTLTTQC